MKHRKYTLVLRGEDDNALDEALAEACDRMLAGNLEGADSEENSAFYFSSTEAFPEGEHCL